jgi:hypothetical protein
MLDQIVTPEIARQLHAEALRTRGMAMWIVTGVSIPAS